MKDLIKRGALPYATLFLGALAACAVMRVALAAMDATGEFSYNYRAATAPYVFGEGSLLDQLVYILTGSTLGLTVLASGMAFGICALAVLLFAMVYGKGAKGTGAGTTPDGAASGARLGVVALVWGALALIVALACFGVLVGGGLSAVQLHQLASKGGGGGAGAGMLLVLAAFATQIAGASCMLAGLVGRGIDGAKGAARAIGAVALFSAAVAVSGAITFAAIDSDPANGTMALAGIALGIVVNAGMIALGTRMARR